MYLVLEEFDHLGRAYGETDEARADRDTMIRDLISGQYDKPVRIVAFNTAKEWPGVGMRPISASFELPGIEPLAAIGITFILLVLPHYIIIVEYSAPLRGVSTRGAAGVRIPLQGNHMEVLHERSRGKVHHHHAKTWTPICCGEVWAAE